MIHNIIFDLGNVVFKLKWNIVLEKYANTEKDKKILEDVIFNSKEWEKLDEGTIKKNDAINIMLSRLPENLHSACLGIMKDWKEGLILNNQTIDFIKKIREKGYKTYILSNAPADIPDFLIRCDLNQYFDGQIISAEEKILKPNYQIYKLILNRFSLEPKDCLFLDDKVENISAAIDCGINGYVFDYNNFDKFLSDINEKYNII